MSAEGGKKVENDMRLYHGSKSGLTGTIAPVSRDFCDFGRGFYMGTEKTQPLTLICHGGSPKFYEIDYDLEGLRVYRFEANLDWAMFVAWNRQAIPERLKPYYDEKFLPIAQSNDVIVGKIANDRMVVVLDWFFQGFISDIGLLESLQALNLGDQYCAVTPAACARVRIVNEKSLTANECEMLRVTSENQRKLAVRMVDRIRLLHRRDGMSFQEIIERDTGRRWDEP